MKKDLDRIREQKRRRELQTLQFLFFRCFYCYNHIVHKFYWWHSYTNWRVFRNQIFHDTYCVHDPSDFLFPGRKRIIRPLFYQTFFSNKGKLSIVNSQLAIVFTQLKKLNGFFFSDVFLFLHNYCGNDQQLKMTI